MLPRALPIYIKVYEGETRVLTHIFDQETLRIGNEPLSGLRLEALPARQHITLQRGTDGGITIIYAELSTARLNGDSLHPRPLYAEDELVLGPYRLVFSGLPARPQPAPTPPPPAPAPLPAPSPHLQLALLGKHLRRYLLAPGEQWIGSGEGCQILLRNSDLAPRHAVILVHDQEVSLRVAPGVQRPGVWYQGARLRHQTPLALGHCAWIGGFRLRYSAPLPEPRHWIELSGIAEGEGPLVLSAELSEKRWLSRTPRGGDLYSVPFWLRIGARRVRVLFAQENLTVEGPAEVCDGTAGELLAHPLSLPLRSRLEAFAEEHPSARLSLRVTALYPGDKLAISGFVLAEEFVDPTHPREAPQRAPSLVMASHLRRIET